MPDDLERQLDAFGRTLREGTGEPIQPDHAGPPVTSVRPATRRWARLGAAACLVAAVVGIGLAVGNRASAPTAPADGSTRNDDGAARPVMTTSDAEPVPADPLALERDGWILVRRSTERFSMGADELPCEVDGLAAIDGIDQIHDILTPPGGDGLDLDVQILDVGSVDRGNALADAIMVIGRCLGEAEGIEIDTGALSSVRATWFRAGPEFALVTIVGDGPRSIVLEIEGAPFDDDLIGELAHRADDFLGGRPVAGMPSPTVSVGEGTAVGEQQVEPDAGQVQLWVRSRYGTSRDQDTAASCHLAGVPRGLA